MHNVCQFFFVQSATAISIESGEEFGQMLESYVVLFGVCASLVPLHLDILFVSQGNFLSQIQEEPR